MKIESNAQVIHAFDYLVNQVTNPKLRAVCEELKKYPDYWTWPASTNFHHNFEGGLILHTLEVVGHAIHAAKMFEEADSHILLTAALWHDLAKVWEYRRASFNPALWEKTDYHGKVHHISGSTAEFTAIAMNHGVDRETIQKIQHCIISHHGIKEWGSPRKPESLEAILLHQADMLSAMYPKHKHPVI